MPHPSPLCCPPLSVTSFLLPETDGLYNSNLLLDLLRSFVAFNQASYFARRMFTLPSLSDIIV